MEHLFLKIVTEFFTEPIRNEVAFSYHRVSGQNFQAVIFAVTIILRFKHPQGEGIG